MEVRVFSRRSMLPQKLQLYHLSDEADWGSPWLEPSDAPFYCRIISTWCESDVSLRNKEHGLNPSSSRCQLYDLQQVTPAVPPMGPYLRNENDPACGVLQDYAEKPITPSDRCSLLISFHRVLRETWPLAALGLWSSSPSFPLLDSLHGKSVHCFQNKSQGTF